MEEKENVINLYIAYSSNDEPLYKKIKSHLIAFKKSGEIKSITERELVGKKWNQVISDDLLNANVVVMLISPDFLVSEYCYGDEMREALRFHKKGRLDFIPVLLREVDLEGTLFNDLEMLPPERKPIQSRYWRNETVAVETVIEGLEQAFRRIITPSEDIFLVSVEKALSCCIKQFSIKNFLCIKNLSLHEMPVDAQWVFITGENGDGKTALLQALAFGLLGTSDGNARRLLKEDQTRIEIEFRYYKKNTIHQLYYDKGQWKIDSDNEQTPSSMKLIGYGVTRLTLMPDEMEKKYSDMHPAASLFDETKGSFKNIETLLKDWERQDEMQGSLLLEDIKNTLVRLMPNISAIEVAGNKVFYKEKGFKGEYHLISSGGKAIIAMVGDMIRHFLKLQPDAEKVAEFEGIVLIDELDLHLHPIWQKKIPGLLSDIFPKIQFWATTHSIVPFMGAPMRSCFLKVTRFEESGTKVEKLDIDVKNLLPNTLISSPLFGVEDIIPAEADYFRSEYLYSEAVRNRELDKKLEEAARKFKLPKSFFDSIK